MEPRWITLNKYKTSLIETSGIILSITLKLLVILTAMVKLVILAIFESVNKRMHLSLPLYIYWGFFKAVTQSLSWDFMVCVSDLNLVVLGKISWYVCRVSCHIDSNKYSKSSMISLITGTLLFALAFLGIIAFWNPSELGRRGKGIIKALIKWHFIYYMLWVRYAHISLDAESSLSRV